MNNLWRGLPLVLSCAVLLVFPCLGDEDPVEKRFQSVSVMDVTFAGENGVVVLNASSFNTAVAIDDSAWLIKFYAPWCGHCKTLAPIIETVAAKSHTPGSRVAIAKVDATYEQALSARFPLKGYPTVFFIKDSAVRIYDGKRNPTEIIKFMKSGYINTKPLGPMVSPLGVVGKLKGLVVVAGVRIADLYDYLVDINGSVKLEPWQAITAICLGGLVLTFLAGLAFAWLFGFTTSTHPHLD